MSEEIKLSELAKKLGEQLSVTIPDDVLQVPSKELVPIVEFVIANVAAPAHADEPVGKVPKEWIEFSIAAGETSEGILRRAVINIMSMSPLSLLTASPQEIARSAYAAAEALRAHPSAGIRSEWMPIETAPKDERVFFWVVSKNADEAPLDSSGNPILGRGEPHRHEGKYGSWSGLSKAIYWMPLPAPPRALGESS